MKLIRIETQSGLDAFLDTVDRLHDSILREIGIVARGFVDGNRRMFGDTEPADARLLFQSQSPDFSCVEVFFEGVETLLVRPNLPIEPEGVVGDSTIRLYLGPSYYEERPLISAQRMSYRLLDASCLGSAPRFISSALPTVTDSEGT